MSKTTQEASKQSFIMLNNSNSKDVWKVRILLALRCIGEGNKSQITKEINRLIPYINASEENVHKRMSELVKMGLVKDTGRMIISEVTGRSQTIWRLKV